jgi:hypothetical protein
MLGINTRLTASQPRIMPPLVEPFENILHCQNP